MITTAFYFKANINEKDNDGITALHHAAWNNYKDTAEVLISYGANINEKDNDGRTVLHNAVLDKQEEIVGLLISPYMRITQVI
ncbi:hypothetical protein TVAG_152270 [Trichomonas vaginalis G3]|uniref:Uncharacterized protein n=1 Tax=Trichomonas vaginalis (strain ATCC PRA-98 / G3) TaxID=412133 RepID=A2F703_TRIV3|nr:Ankyrin repeat family [Trichomonas vaginalis G3]EAX99308.1 hypothetical protein TVAG_152270 [Trichomonas vaginalis G3]KAI5500493.1 Ankyrin repeat family [Trichomonas vaginalis G3]|eukprot:XP_001312238.1 hypothetical protein [Trichomonas vaginalis G3]